MYPTLAVTLLGVIAAISWGTADFFAAKASRRNSPEATALWVSIIGTIAFAAIYFIFPGDLSWTRSGVFYAIAAGISLEIGLFMLFRGLDAGPVSIVSPISSAYPLISVLIALVVFGVSLRTLDVVGILVAVAGVVIASGLYGIKRSERKFTPGVAYGITAFLLWGLAYAMLAKSVTTIGWQKSALVDTLAGLIALTIVLALTSDRKTWLNIKTKSFKDPYVLGTAFIQLIGGIAFTIGLEHARSTAVITTISATYPALTIFLALKHFEEKRQILPIAGAALAIIGVIILSV
jgi:drug/metabolite transporter (DMT)-like permease